MNKLLRFINQNEWTRDLQELIPEYKKQIWILVIIVVAFLLQRIVRYLLKRFIDKSSEEMNTDPTQFKFLRNIARFVIYTTAMIAIIYMIPAFKKVALSLFAGVGIITAAIALASQAALSNIIGGIFLVIFKPIRMYDHVKIGSEFEGVVEDINLRHTTLKNGENRRVIVPNSVMNSATIINSSIVESKTCRYLNIPVSYQSDLDKALILIQKLAEAHPKVYDARTTIEKEKNVPKVKVQAVDFLPTGVLLRADIWGLSSVDAFDACCDLRREVKYVFDKEGIDLATNLKNIIIDHYDKTTSEKPE